MPNEIYKIVLHKAAVFEIKKLPAKIKKRVCAVIDALAADPFPMIAQRLKGRKNAYRILVADHRIVYEIHATELVVYVVGIAHRKEVYRRLLRRK